MTNPGDSPGIRVIPPLVYAIAFLIGYGLEHAWPLVDESWKWTSAGGIILACASFFLVVPAILLFRRASTPLDVRKPATTLITQGPYRYSRNPQYLALTLLYSGLALLTASAWVLVLLVPTLVVMTYGVVKKEEAYLERHFGDEYREYKSRVRRWL